MASNIVPEEMVALVSAAWDGAMDEAREIHYRLLPFFQALFIETNPIPVKAAMAALGKIDEVYRLPMCPMAKQNKKVLLDTMKTLGLR